MGIGDQQRLVMQALLPLSPFFRALIACMYPSKAPWSFTCNFIMAGYVVALRVT